MTPWMRMLLPVGFGIVAAAINFFVLRMMNQQTEYVSVKIQLVQGAPFTPENVQSLKVSGDAAKLNKAWIRWNDVHTIYGRPSGRTLDVGELILRQDAEPVKELKPGPDEDAMVIGLGTVEVEPKLLLIGERIGFLIRAARVVEEESSEEEMSEKEAAAARLKQLKKPDPQDVDIKYLGPFRLLSVGDRLSRNVGESKKDSRGDGRTVTIAIPKIKEGDKLDDKVERLVRASTKSGSRGESDLLKLVLHRSLIGIRTSASPDSTTHGESSMESAAGSTDQSTDTTDSGNTDSKPDQENSTDSSSENKDTEN